MSAIIDSYITQLFFSASAIVQDLDHITPTSEHGRGLYLEVRDFWHWWRVCGHVSSHELTSLGTHTLHAWRSSNLEQVSTIRSTFLFYSPCGYSYSSWEIIVEVAFSSIPLNTIHEHFPLMECSRLVVRSQPLISTWQPTCSPEYVYSYPFA